MDLILINEHHLHINRGRQIRIMNNTPKPMIPIPALLGELIRSTVEDPLLTSSRQQDYSGEPPAEGERGILGALGGGVSGGYIGKQTCHGFLGTVGGAIVGSLTEDWAKKKKPLCGRPTTPTPCPPQQQPPPCNNGQVYSPPIVDNTTTVSSSTQVQPGYWQQTPPVYHHGAPPKPCGHQHACTCHYFGK